MHTDYFHYDDVYHFMMALLFSSPPRHALPRHRGMALPLLLQIGMFATPVVYPERRANGFAISICSTRWSA